MYFYLYYDKVAVLDPLYSDRPVLTPYLGRDFMLATLRGRNLES